MIQELKEYENVIGILIRFVSGEIEGSELQNAIETPQMQNLLSHFADPRLPALTNHLRRLQVQDRETIGGLLNSQGIIEDFLKEADVEFTASTRYFDAYRLILSSLPSYLDPPMEFIMPLIPDDPSMSATKKKKALKERLKEVFPYIEKPPKWIQSPEWPIDDGKPLVFLGQLSVDAPSFFHDSGMAYLFYSPDNGSFETVFQIH